MADADRRQLGNQVQVQGFLSFRKIAVPLAHCVPYTNQCHKQAVCEAAF